MDVSEVACTTYSLGVRTSWVREAHAALLNRDRVAIDADNISHVTITSSGSPAAEVLTTGNDNDGTNAWRMVDCEAFSGSTSAPLCPIAPVITSPRCDGFHIPSALAPSIRVTDRILSRLSARSRGAGV